YVAKARKPVDYRSPLSRVLHDQESPAGSAQAVAPTEIPRGRNCRSALLLFLFFPLTFRDAGSQRRNALCFNASKSGFVRSHWRRDFIRYSVASLAGAS